MSPIEKVLNIAKQEIGYLEKANKNNLYHKTANAGSKNFTKYWAEVYPEFQGEPWCACFVTWVLDQAFGKNKTKELLKHYPFVYCPTLGKLLKLKANPAKGDIVLFYNNKTKVFYHTGIVSSVNGDYFTTIEGNTSGGSEIIPNGGGVCAKGYHNSKLPGTKFVTPDWSLVEEKIEFTETPCNLQVQITADSLNIRNLPSTDGKVLARHSKNDIVVVCAKTNNGWYKAYYPNYGYGYFSASYAKLFPQKEELSQIEFNNLLQNYLNYRCGLDGDPWSADARWFCENQGIINGDENGYKKYKAFLTREELAVILYNLFGRR